MGLLTGCFPGLFEVLQFWNANNIENKKIKNRNFFILVIKVPEILAKKKGLIERPSL